MTYARLLEMFSRSKRVQEQGSSSSGADVASIPARLCEILTGFSKGGTRVISRLNARPGYKGGGQSIRATKTKLAQINPGNSTNGWLKLRRHRSICLEVIQVRSLSDPNLYLVLATESDSRNLSKFQKLRPFPIRSKIDIFAPFFF